MKIGVSSFVCTIVSIVAVSGMYADPHSHGGKGDWDVFLGLGAMVSPVSPGLSETETDVIPFLDVTYKDRFFLGRYGLGGYLFRGSAGEHGEGFDVGLSIGMGEGRDVKDYADYLAGMGDVEEGIEANFFLKGALGPADYQWVVSQGLDSDGHDGLHSELSLLFSSKLGDNLAIEFGPFAHYADSNYMQSFYGVTETQAGLSRFSDYTPGSGFDRAGLKLVARTRLTGNWMLMGMLEYNSLLGDAKDSPIVEDKDYVTFGMGLGFKF